MLRQAGECFMLWPWTRYLLVFSIAGCVLLRLGCSVRSGCESSEMVRIKGTSVLTTSVALLK